MPASDRSASHVVQLAGQRPSPPRLLMVNGAAPLLPQAARKLGRKSTAEYYASGSEYAVRKARSSLDRAGVAYSEAFPLGDAAEEVTGLAEKHAIELVGQGTRGQNDLKCLLPGPRASRGHTWEKRGVGI